MTEKTEVRLRPYQEECIAAAEAEWEINPHFNLAVSLPTGAGKTVIMAALAHRYADQGKKVVIIVHRHELVEQTVAKLKDADPMLFVGVVKAQRNEVAADVVVASLQTLARPGRVEKIGPVDLVIYDEAHGSASDSGIDVMTRLGAIGGDAKGIGFSATFYRADGRPLDVVWDKVVFEKDILWAVSQGYLSDARGLSVPIRGLDLGKVKVSGADYQDRDLGQAMMDAHAAEQIADAYVKYASDRKAICFAPTVKAAEAITEELEKRGIAAETVTGTTNAGDRKRIYGRLKKGHTRVLSSVAVLTEGFDEPSVDCVIMARPTKSQGLYVQCVGRGLRLFPGKKDCLILDVSGTSEEQSLVGMSNLAGKEKSSKPQTLKEMADEAPERGPRGLRANLRPVKEFDPFARRKLVWLQTKSGTSFVPTGKNTFVFIHGNDEDGYLIGEATRGRNRDGKWLLDKPVPKDFALPLAEQFVEEIGVGRTKADYRTWSREGATVGQIGFATSLGVPDADKMNKAEISKAIDVAQASFALD